MQCKSFWPAEPRDEWEAPELQFTETQHTMAYSTVQWLLLFRPTVYDGLPQSVETVTVLWKCESVCWSYLCHRCVESHLEHSLVCPILSLWGNHPTGKDSLQRKREPYFIFDAAPTVTRHHPHMLRCLMLQPVPRGGNDPDALSDPLNPTLTFEMIRRHTLSDAPADTLT